MGDRSNLIIITDRREINLATEEPHDLVSGLAIYSHWGGSNAQIDALNAVITHGLKRLNDPSYFARIAVRAFTAGDDGETGSGITPMAVLARHDAPLFETRDQIDPYIPDNDSHPIPVIDLTTNEIRVHYYSFFGPRKPMELISAHPLIEEGLKLAIADVM